MTNEAVYLFISPHLDDVALSCGGYIHRLTSLGERVVVATLITAEPPADWQLTRLARRNHRQWDAGEKPFALRCQEDTKAMESLGAEAIHLSLLDAIYRRKLSGEPLYTKDIVNIPVHAEDWLHFEPVVKEKLTALIQSFGNQMVRIFSPLALATHVDHVIIRHATEKVCDPNCIAYYEEFPYTTRPNVFENWKFGPDGSQGWFSRVIELTDSEINARIAVVSSYRTQVSFLFPSMCLSLHEIALARLPFVEKIFPLKPNREAAIRRMETAVRSYVSNVNGERYWFTGIAPS